MFLLNISSIKCFVYSFYQHTTSKQELQWSMISSRFHVDCFHCRDVDWKPRITSVTSGGKPKWWRWTRREMKSLFISLVKSKTIYVTQDLTFNFNSGWNGRHDEWIKMDSPRLQPLHRRSRQKCPVACWWWCQFCTNDTACSRFILTYCACACSTCSTFYVRVLYFRFSIFTYFVLSLSIAHKQFLII